MADIASTFEINQRIARSKAQADRANSKDKHPPIEIDTSILRLNRRAPPPFPLAIFGAEWMDWIRKAASSACCPVDYVAAPLLATASALIGNARWAQAWHGWEEPPHLWMASVGDSGDGKTPGANTLFRKIVPEIERRMRGDYPERLAEWQADAIVARQRRSQWEDQAGKAVREGNKVQGTPPPEVDDDDAPQEPRLKLHDVTIEKVASMLTNAAPKGLLMFRDELAGFLLGMSVYNDSARPFWLEAWNGSPYSVDRMRSKRPLRVPHLVVSWSGSIQPERLAQLMAEPDDGLLARFVWCWPDPIPFTASTSPLGPDDAIRWLDRLRLLDMHRNSDSTLTPHIVPLETKAVDTLVNFGNRMQRGKEFAAGLLRSSYGKCRGLALRAALVVECLWWCAKEGYDAGPQVISAPALDAATTWVEEYVLPMADRTFGDAACSQVERNVTTLARWVAQEQPAEVHVRKMLREHRLAGLTNAETVHTACRALVDAGWLLPPPKGFHGDGVRTSAYPINPALWGALG